MGGYRWKTLVFYGTLTFLTLIAIILMITVNSKTRFASELIEMQVDVILDAGHGGIDGGAVSADGVCEAPSHWPLPKRPRRFSAFAEGLR